LLLIWGLYKAQKVNEMEKFFYKSKQSLRSQPPQEKPARLQDPRTVHHSGNDSAPGAGPRRPPPLAVAGELPPLLAATVARWRCLLLLVELARLGMQRRPAAVILGSCCPLLLPRLAPRPLALCAQRGRVPRPRWPPPWPRCPGRGSRAEALPWRP